MIESLSSKLSAQKIYCAHHSLPEVPPSHSRTDPICSPIYNPLPELDKEVVEVGEVGLAGWGGYDSLDRDTEEGQRQEKDEDPKNGSK